MSNLEAEARDLVAEHRAATEEDRDLLLALLQEGEAMRRDLREARIALERLRQVDTALALQQQLGTRLQ
jgi:ABC-type transporter Mla MlaB component